MTSHVPWPWCESLGDISADAVALLEIRRIPIGSVRQHCSAIGLREGQRIVCRRRSRDQVIVQLPGGEIRSLELPYGWFVHVRPLATESPTHNQATESLW